MLSAVVCISAFSDRTHLGSAEALERREHAVDVDVRRRAREHELGGMIWVSKAVVERDEAAKRRAEHDRLLDPQCLAESA
jgi:hypothetical protein